MRSKRTWFYEPSERESALNSESIEQLERSAKAGDVYAQVELGNRLVAENRYDTPEFERGLGLLTGVAEKGCVEAQWYAGLFASISDGAFTGLPD